MLKVRSLKHDADRFSNEGGNNYVNFQENFALKELIVHHNAFRERGGLILGKALGK